jgi:hypothetical protein
VHAKRARVVASARQAWVRFQRQLVWNYDAEQTSLGRSTFTSNIRRVVRCTRVNSSANDAGQRCERSPVSRLSSCRSSGCFKSTRFRQLQERSKRMNPRENAPRRNAPCIIRGQRKPRYPRAIALRGKWKAGQAEFRAGLFQKRTSSFESRIFPGDVGNASQEWWDLQRAASYDGRFRVRLKLRWPPSIGTWREK